MEKQKIFWGIVLLILLYLLFRKKVYASEQVTAKIMDPNTGLLIGYEGVGQDPLTIGEIAMQPGILNRVTDPSFQYFIHNHSVPLCPSGYDAIEDPLDDKAYCILSGHGGTPSQGG